MTDFLKLKKANCKHCYKCIRHCPVKSIRFSGGQAHIIGDECILCGHCFVVCPQNAKEIVSSLETVKVLLSGEKPVCASIAPSFIANYNGLGIASLRDALLQLGFSAVEETAIGATIVKKEYERILAEEKPNLLISSCCHGVNLLIQKYFPKELPYLAPVLSPMQAHAQDIQRRRPAWKTVFIGPCIAKKDEAQAYDGFVDAVLTFEELSQWLQEENISLMPEQDNSLAAAEEGRARFFPVTGGILKTMACTQKDYTYLAVDGVENCIAALKDIEKGGLQHCFIEMSACTGSCIGGPVMEKFHPTPLRDYAQVSAYAGKKDFNVTLPPAATLKKSLPSLAKQQETPSSQQIAEILQQMGKTKPEQELNCGSCGYSSCREKAIAVYQGKAEISMCLPFLKDKAECFSDNIISNTPNAILVLNEALEVQQINPAALHLLQIRQPEDVLGEPVVRILDPEDFMAVQQSGVTLKNKRTYLADYQRYVEETILFDRDYHILICIMRDVTAEEAQREKKESIRRQTISTADEVVNKQMRVAQEIASLLGETVAETKIALTKLKESIRDE